MIRKALPAPSATRGSGRAVLCAALMALALGAGPARAAEPVNHPFEAARSFDGHTTPSGSFDAACGLAIGPSRSIYVSDYFHGVIDRFSSGRIYEARTTRIASANGPCGLAVDSGGTLYVDVYHEGVRAYAPSEFTIGPGTQIDSGNSTGVAVDPTSGDLYVDDGTYIAHYSAPIVPGEEPERIGDGSLGEGYGIAVSAGGRIYVADAATRTVKVYDPALDSHTPVAEISGAGTPQRGFTSLRDSALAIDPTNGHLFVLDTLQAGFEHPAAVFDEFSGGGNFRGQLPHGFTSAQPSAIAVDLSGSVYATGGNGIESSVFAFGPASPGRLLSLTTTGTGAGAVNSAPSGINCPGACAAEFDEGAAVSLSASPDPHSVFLGWSGCPLISGPEGRQCSLTMSANQDISAEFEALPQQQLALNSSGPGTVISAPIGIDCPGQCSAAFNQGSSVLLTATPTERGTFAGWSGCDSEPGGRCQVTMGADRSLQAQFQPIPQQPLTVQLEGTGTGAVRGSNPGTEFTPIDCGEVCRAEYNAGAEITLLASPGSGSKLTGWSGCDSNPQPGECIVVANAQRSVTATFEPIRTFVLTIAKGGHGAGVVRSAPAAIECGASCSGSFEDGEAVTLSARPDAGSEFVGWSGPCAGDGPCRVVLDHNTTVSATFGTKSRTSPPPNPRLAFKLGSGKPKREGAVALSLTVPAPGALAASGAHLLRARTKVAAAGPATLLLRLDRAGLRALRIKRHIEVKVQVTFTPAGGKARSLEKVVGFRRVVRPKGAAALAKQGSYLSASCPTPAGIPRAIFPLARISAGFTDGTTLNSTLSRECEALK